MQKRNQNTAPGSHSPGFRPSQLRQYSLASTRCIQTWPLKRGGRSCRERGATRNSGSRRTSLPPALLGRSF
eukprot:6459410-Pyramimonas_sp.AAC.1